MLQGSIVALITPMRADGELDGDAWRRLLDWHIAAGTDGVVVAGTTGESASLTEAEFAWLLESALAQARGRLRVLAGTGFPSTRATIERSRLAASLGADAALVVTPAYVRPPQRGLIAHYRAVADACPIPVVLYNVPSRTAVDLQAETSLALAEHPNIIGIKEALADPQRIQQLVDGGLAVLSGDDPSCCESMLAGARGVISVAGNLAPEQMAKLCRLALAGAAAEARALSTELAPLFRCLGLEPNPIPAKWMLARAGWIADRLRLPLVSLDARHHAEAEAVLAGLRLDATADTA